MHLCVNIHQPDYDSHAGLIVACHAQLCQYFPLLFGWMLMRYAQSRCGQLHVHVLGLVQYFIYNTFEMFEVYTAIIYGLIACYAISIFHQQLASVI